MGKIFQKILCTLLVVVMCLTNVFLVGSKFTAEAINYKVGDIIQFGSYPQSEVKEESLIAELNALAPDWDNWISYNYYTGIGGYDTNVGKAEFGSMEQGDWMRYTDITYNGNKYRGVKFTQYRPQSTTHKFYENYENHSRQYYNGYYTNTIYWFVFESIKWRVLDTNTGLIMSETIIDSQPYNNTIYYQSGVGSTYCYFNDSPYKHYSSDYENSSIRKWLNDNFYNTAFTDSEKNRINTTTLNNDGYYTSKGLTGYEKLDSNETVDKIFLISYNEAINNNFNFNEGLDIAKRACGSDYAKSQGLLVHKGNTYNDGGSYWLLRSPGNNSSACCIVHYDGRIMNYLSSCYTEHGIRPALYINDNIIEHQHIYNSVVIKPTCTNEGYTYYICECGDSYVDDYTDIINHKHISEITTQPTHLTEGVQTFTCECGDSYTKPVTKLESHTYKSFIIKSTCTANGYTTYTCACGDTYIETIEPTGHVFANGSSKCENCNFDKADNCSCNCHKGGFMGFIWKLINIFNKLFKSNKACTCGVAHY